MKLGAMDYLLPGKTPSEMFTLAKSLSFHGVEINLHREHLRSDNGLLVQIKNASESSGVEVSSLVLGEHNYGGVSSSDQDVVSQAKEDIKAAIGWARELGASIILVPFFGKGEIITQEDFERAVEAFRELCPKAEAFGIKLCYEGTLPAQRIKEMASAVGSPAGFGCYFDLANIVCRGLDTATEIRTLGSLVSQVHIKDCLVGTGDCHLGHGFVDFAESSKALREIGFDGWLVLETPASPPPIVQRDATFARKWFPEVGLPEWPHFGAFTWDYQPNDWNKLVEDFGNYGLKYVQLSGPLLTSALASDSGYASALNYLKNSGLSVAAIGAYCNLVAPDDVRRRDNIDFLKRCIKAAPGLGTYVVATETGSFNPESDWLPTQLNKTEQAWHMLLEALDELVPVAKENNVVLALEGYVNNVLYNFCQIEALNRHYNSDNLQLVLDPYNYISSYLLPAHERLTQGFLFRFESSFVIAHLKDVSAEGAEVETPEFGAGVFSQQPYLEFLRRQRFDLPLILEHLPMDHIPSVIKQVLSIKDQN